MSDYVEVLLESSWSRLVMACYDVVFNSTVDFWRDREVPFLPAPLTTQSVSSPAEPGSDSVPVAVEIQGSHTYLTDSAQFFLEVGCRMSKNGCYYVMPSFRGDTPDRTHLSQFFHSEAELPCDLEQIMSIVEDYLRALMRRFIDELGTDIARHVGSTHHLESAADSSPKRVEYREACRILESNPAFLDRRMPGRPNITRAGEEQLMERYGGLVWVMHMDHLVVPFYQAFADHDESLAMNADLLLGPGELVGSGERHSSADDVRKALERHAVPGDEYTWYVRMRELSKLRTSGFGLGVERLLMFVLQHDDIRDIPALPGTQSI